MRIVDCIVEDGCLHITCAGRFGIGSQGNPSGDLIKDRLELALERSGSPISRVVVDFTQVDYEWGDGPAWSVLPALKRGLKVSYLARGKAKEALAGLFDASGLHLLGELSVTEPLTSDKPR
jgi:hypothetical protein